MNEEERLDNISGERLFDEMYEYITDGFLEGDMYFEQYMQEIRKRLKLLDELQELEKVRRTW